MCMLCNPYFTRLAGTPAQLEYTCSVAVQCEYVHSMYLLFRAEERSEEGRRVGPEEEEAPPSTPPKRAKM